MRKFCILSLSFLLLAVAGKGQEHVYRGIIPTVSPAVSFAVGSSVFAEDPVYADPILQPSIGTTRKMQNVVLLRFNEESAAMVPSDFNVEVTVDLVYSLPGGLIATGTKKLSLDYKLGANQKSDAISYFVQDQGGYTFSAEITAISSNVSWDVRPFLQLITEVHSEYDAPFNGATSITTLSDDAPSGPTPFDELNVTWTYPTGTGGGFSSFPTHYDLEWAWVDYDARDEYKTAGSWDATKIFANNMTRVTVPISQNSYAIPLMYDGRGYILYRVRAVQQKIDGQLINGVWSTSLSTGAGIYEYEDGHESSLNWQAATSYAEDGKRKTVIQYFDGTLRGRQTVTKDNSITDVGGTPVSGTTVVAETYYDFQGRPTIQVLPTPTLSNVIAFTRNFNNNAIDQDGYPKEIYDLLTTGQTACEAGAPALDQSPALSGPSGAGNYYSSQNPLSGTGIHKFIPDANGFAFTETRYTQDATGRILAQGGVGEAFQLGTGHETKYFYSTPSQDELDLLFGTDAGYASHYQKMVVRDPNGQYSVSYTDMHGRTVATALAGATPASVKELKSLRALEDAAIPPRKKQLLDEQTNVVNGRDITMVKSLMVTTPGERHFEYRLNPAQLLLKNCSDHDVCFDCLYDLKITVKRDCDNYEMYTYTLPHFSIPYSTTCGTDPDDISVDFDVYLDQPGTYTVTKILSVSKDAQDMFRNEAMQPDVLLCKTLETITSELESTMLTQNTNCKPTCEDCETRLGTLSDFRSAFMADANLTEPDMPVYEALVIKAYNTAKAACDQLCENDISDRIEDTRKIMLLDMTPDRGQYARIMRDDRRDENGELLPAVDISNRPFNIFGDDHYLKPLDAAENPDQFRNADGNVDPSAPSVTSAVTREEFTNLFQESWANQLLPYHPEYKKLQLMETAKVRSAYVWQEKWQNKEHWADVSAVMTGLPSSDPFYADVLADAPTLQSDFIYDVAHGVKINATFYDLWPVALAAVTCKDLPSGSQVTCINSAVSSYSTVGSFPFGFCTADKDRVWTIFSALYFRVREIYLAKYFQLEAPVDQSLFDPPTNPDYIQYQPRFYNLESAGILQTIPTDLQSVYTEGNQNYHSGSAPHNNVTEGVMDDQYEENCRSYAAQWLDQLHLFDNCAGIDISGHDYDNLVETLVSICHRGSDADHPLGSSSVSPSNFSFSEPNSFEEALQDFMTAHSIPVTETCHPFILNWPKPYESSPSFGDEVIWETKPPDCICTRIQSIEGDYNLLRSTRPPKYSGTFNDYLKEYYGVNISDAELTELLTSCVSTPSCNYRSEPLVIPPALQCNAPENVCISCEQYQTNRSAFYSTFGGAMPMGMQVPTLNPTDDITEKWNQTFADFMNYRLGFAKTWQDYAGFEKQCEYGAIADARECPEDVASILSDFYANLDDNIQDGVHDCYDLFTAYFNNRVNGDFTFGQIAKIYQVCGGTSCLTLSCCPDCRTSHTIACTEPFQTHLCGLNEPISPVFEESPDDPCNDVFAMAVEAGIDEYKNYIQQVKDNFDKAYLEKCLNVQELESFTVESPNENEYHYTLYYYDQAGNLVQTVPPAGVDNFSYDETTRNAFLASVEAARANPALPSVKPDHSLVTVYRYNTLNQVVEQKSPDGGLSRFWYDELGRLVVSQNAKQAVSSRYSYTIYDAIGRITQVGEKPTSTAMTQLISRSPADLTDWLDNTGSAKVQITRTVYDVPYAGGSPTPLLEGVLEQRNLRNRVSYTEIVPVEPASPGDPDSWALAHSSATFYTYDIHGNVDTLVQDYNFAPMSTVDRGKNRFKKIAYNYDLISGKVNLVSYQPDYYDVTGALQHHQDHFYHRYTYDAENKLTLAQTSADGIIWESDARYEYYKHGPLARVVLGQQQVQGLDYAYTLQGWLKGVNGSALTAFDEENRCDPNPCFTSYVTGDMGEDGKDGGVHQWVARDAYSFSLNFYQTTINSTAVVDYKPIGTGVDPFVGNVISLSNGSETVAKPLFNGNIASMFVNIPRLGDAQLYGYQYDQLNRIVGMDAFGGFDAASTGWTGGTPTASDNYRERVSYDPNGNILTYQRNGFGGTLDMDNLTYQYPKDPVSGKMINNRLRYVHDQVADGNYSEDIDSQTPLSLSAVQAEELPEQSTDNYVYDEIGNLVKDVNEGITSITWTLYGKIATISKTVGGVTTDISYSYDASGNRVLKQVGDHYTIYVRDAAGNVMSVYDQDAAINSGHLTQSEVHLYGSSRLGIMMVNRDLEEGPPSGGLGDEDEDGVVTFTRGNKFFELSNHLGNVLVTITDRKLQVSDLGTSVDYYMADIASANDYYPFGMLMPGRKYSAGTGYRYGFNGKEEDKDINSLSAYDYGFRIYNPAIGRFLSVDPLTHNYPWFTPYQFAGNEPTIAIDLDGLEGIEVILGYERDKFLMQTAKNLEKNPTALSQLQETKLSEVIVKLDEICKANFDPNYPFSQAAGERVYDALHSFYESKEAIAYMSVLHYEEYDEPIYSKTIEYFRKTAELILNDYAWSASFGMVGYLKDIQKISDAKGPNERAAAIEKRHLDVQEKRAFFYFLFGQVMELTTGQLSFIAGFFSEGNQPQDSSPNSKIYNSTTESQIESDAAKTSSKIAVQFGKTENQIYHAFRHTDALGLDRSLVQSTIQNHFKTVSSQVVAGKPFNQIIEIGGQRIQYTAFKLSDGTFNIGRIHGVK